MPCNIKNPANIDLSNLEPHINGMYDYFDQKLGFKKPPTMVFDSDPSNQPNVLGKTAYYDPSTLEIHIYSDGRHPKDMLRSIAHELIHHQQNLEGRLDVGGYHGEGYYLENKELKKLEHEAMLNGNALMREYEDTRKRKEINEMSLNEWKNNELNRLLMKKFGILKEAADYKRDDADKNDGLEGGKDTSYGHEKPGEKEKERLKEDSGEEEKEHYEHNAWSDKDHIEAIEKHLDALKKDKEYDEDHEEERRDEHRNRKDKLVGHDDRDPEGLVVEEGTIEDDLLDKKDAEKSDEEDSDAIGPVGESLKESIKRVLKQNKKLKLRFKK